MTILGARPQFIKAAALSKAIAEHPEWTEVVLHTGQHFDKNMSEVFFEQLEMSEPNYNLGINSMTHGAMTGHMMIDVEKIVLEEQPDVVVVYGDTNSTIAGALVASKLHIPIGHVEAGLRAFDKRIPEEVNRVVTDHISDLLFAPTDTAVQNLRKEGIAEELIYQTGDIMLDTIMLFRDKARKVSRIIDDLDVSRGDFILTTIHRQSNTDDEAKLKEIFSVLEDVARTKPVVLPMHPRTASRIKKFGIELNHITVIEPVGYLDMVALLDGAELVITDSGGLQKEAFFCRTPCLTVRDQTEWIELVQAGWNVLSGVEGLRSELNRILDSGVQHGKDVHPYGDGKAAHRMLEILTDKYARTESPVDNLANE